MFKHATRMRFRTDCGVAAYATVAGVAWDDSAWKLGVPWQGLYGLSQDAMAKAIRIMPSGASLLDAKGSQGVALCRVETDDDCADVTPMHWLAWEKDEQGQVWCFNPWNGETFRAASMTGRGFYALCHFTVA